MIPLAESERMGPVEVIREWVKSLPVSQISILVIGSCREPYAFETELPLTRLDRRDQNRHVPSRRNFTGAPVHTASHGSHSLPAR